MCAKRFLLFLVFINFYSSESKLLDSVESLSSLELDEDLSRVRRDSSSSTSEDDVWAKEWKTWTTFIEKASRRNFNISIIGWENIYDVSGNIKEVNALELGFPVREDAEIFNMLKYDTNDDLHDRSAQHKVIKHFDIYKRISKRGILVDIFIESRDKHTGDSSNLLHWTPDSMYFRANGLVTYNKTQTATKEEVQKFIEELRSKNESFVLKPLVLVYNEDHTLKQDEGKLWEPSAISHVVDSWEASAEILLESPRIMEEVVLTVDKEHIPEKLAQSFTQKFPEYDWRVLVNPDEFYLIKDVWVTLSTDALDFYEGKKDIYFVYGIKI